MRNENDRHTLMLELLNPANAALLKEKITDRQRLVDDQDVGIHVDGYGEGKPDEHAAGIGLYRTIDEIAYFRELFNRRDPLPRLYIGKTENGRVKEDVLAPGELRIEPGAKFQQCGHASTDLDIARRWTNDPGNHSQQRAFSGAVLPDDPETTTARQIQVDATHGPEGFMESPCAETEKFFQVIGRMPVDAKTLGDLRGPDNRHGCHIISVAQRRRTAHQRARTSGRFQ